MRQILKMLTRTQSITQQETVINFKIFIFFSKRFQCFKMVKTFSMFSKQY